MIYYELQHHGSGIKHLPFVELFASPSAILSVSLDTSDDNFEDLNDSINRLNFASVRIARSPALSWGGYSIVAQMLSAIESALEVPNWEFYINISGACVPLASPGRIYTALTNNLTNKGIRAYCDGFAVRRPISWFIDSDSERNQTTFKYGRVHFNCDHELNNMLSQKDLDPAKNITQMVGLFFEEFDKNYFNLRKLRPKEAKYRRSFFTVHPYMVGRQWMILHRSVAEWLISAQITQELILIFQNSFIPDESFFQMALFNSTNPFRDSIHNRNLWLNGGGPKELDFDFLINSLNSNALFARKAKSADQLRIRKLLKDVYHDAN